jgi:DNA repair exonuclease SbcCD ATPase subunit
MLIFDSLKPEELLLPEGLGFSPDKVAQRNAKTSKAIEAALEARSRGPSERMRLVSVGWQWVYGYGAKCFFEPGPSGRPCFVRGANASGKSSFSEVVGLALFGAAASCYVVNVGKPDEARAWVEASCAVGDRIYRVRREFEAKNDKLAQTATVVEDGTGAVVAAGRPAVAEWVGRFVTAEDFLLLDRRDADLLAMKPAEQKAILDRMCRSEAVQAEMAAANEAKKAFKWMATALESARDALRAASASDPDDGALADAMLEARLAAREVAVCRAQTAFASSSKARASASLAGLVSDDAVPRRVPGDELARLRDEEGAARSASTAAEARLRDVLRREPPRLRDVLRREPPRQTASKAEDASYLLEKVERYREADGLFRSIPRPVGAFDPGCWACVERHGADVQRREAAEKRLAEMGVGDAREVAAKLRGYEARLKKASEEEAWEAEVAGAREDAEKAAARHREASEAHREARVASQLFELGMTPAQLRRYSLSKLPSVLQARMRLLLSAQNSRVAAASELKALRKRANEERTSSGRLSGEAEMCAARAARLKELHAAAASRHGSMYQEAASELARSANGVLGAAYGIEISGEWTGSSVAFRFSSPGGAWIPVDKASGFERAVISLALKAGLRELGCGSSCGWMVIDEANSGFDEANAGKLEALLEGISNLGPTVVALVSSGTPIAGEAVLKVVGGHRHLEFVRA